MPQPPGYLSKREQQIMEIAFSRDGVTANELCAAMPGNPSNATVRTLLRILEEKGQLTHREESGRFVYSPAQSRQSAARQALDKLVDTFFRGSVGDVVATLIRDDRSKLSDEEIERLQSLIEEAKRANG
ncbi:BlaI/MecI/CopY family transcriptional regulator [bacterium]|nr:MAG: BlaI/MecI/CopY family transcriptional regulator [bacterium]